MNVRIGVISYLGMARPCRRHELGDRLGEILQTARYENRVARRKRASAINGGVVSRHTILPVVKPPLA